MNYSAHFGQNVQKPASFTVRNDRVGPGQKNLKKWCFWCFSWFSRKVLKSGIFLDFSSERFCRGPWGLVSGFDQWPFFTTFDTPLETTFWPLKNIKNHCFCGFFSGPSPLARPTIWPEMSEKCRKWPKSGIFTKMLKKVENVFKKWSKKWPFFDVFDSQYSNDLSTRFHRSWETPKNPKNDQKQWFSVFFLAKTPIQSRGLGPFWQNCKNPWGNLGHFDDFFT